jgi:predicted enzyme related to lactoylglutathione lyase
VTNGENINEDQVGQRVRGQPGKSSAFLHRTDEPDGTELQLALNDSPAAGAYQQAIFQQRQPAIMFYTDDVRGDYEQIKARGAEFAMPPTDVTGSTIAQLNDTCGNLVQITQLRW